MANEQDKRKSILDRLSACDLGTLQRLDALLEEGVDNPADSGSGYIQSLRAVANGDVRGLRASEKSYGDSWKRRGGVDTFHMLTRKWDRLERRLATPSDAIEADSAAPYDIFERLAGERRASGIIDDVRDLRRYLVLIEAEVKARKANSSADSGRGFLEYLNSVVESDIETIEEKEKSYGSSWKRRGGIAAFMMLARKWDRIDLRVTQQIETRDDTPGAVRDNVFEHIFADRRTESVLDDIQDLRRFLMLVEAEMAARGTIRIGTDRDNRDAG